MFLKPLAAINLPKSPKFLGNFSKGVKIFHFSSEIIFWQLLLTFGDFLLVTLFPSPAGSTSQFQLVCSELLPLVFTGVKEQNFGRFCSVFVQITYFDATKLLALWSSS